MSKKTIKLMENCMKNVALYVRVSKGDQRPEIQIDQLKSYSLNHGYNIVKIYVDVISGTKDSRPQFNELMFDSRKGLFNAVIVSKLDRLGRSLNHLINVVEEWYKNKIDFVCVTQNIDTTTPTGKLTFHILGAVAEFERELISERTKQGLKKAKNVGKRGKDKKKRRTSGYNLRYQKKGGLVNA